MKTPFTKMQALGNDFVVFDATRQALSLTAAMAARIAHRQLGIGCDQILLVEASDRDAIDFKYRILNADGSEVGQCGNGARCFMHFVRQQGLTDKRTLSVATLGGDLLLELLDDDQVRVNMGIPKFAPADIPLAVDNEAPKYSIKKDGDAIEFYALSIGNPHAVIEVDNVSSAPVDLVGPMLESHPLFPERVNVGFMQINSKTDIALRVFERGAGETLACGSGACAAVVAGIRAGKLANQVSAQLPGGRLQIEWAGNAEPVFMSGPAYTSFTGEIDLSEL
ncbi:MAG: diaminopimelate epimerase [Gammaproteobacteria bacterium]|nr:diaminopimelate epimerase [Gammaproteobacteria bacterium]